MTYLRSAVPARGDIVGHGGHFALELWVVDAGEAEVANLQIAVAVDKQVARLHVPVDHVGSVQVLEPAQDLAHERTKEWWIKMTGVPQN